MRILHSYEKPEHPGVDPESSKDRAMKDFATKRIKSYELELRQYNEQKQESSLLEKALSGDYVAAYDFLSSRSEFEYENFDILEVEVA